MGLELTGREKRIILVKYIIHGTSPFAEEPLESRIKMLKIANDAIGLTFDEQELMNIGNECLQLQDTINKSIQEYVKANNDLVIRSHIELNKGNDLMTNMLGKSTVDKALKILKRGSDW